MSALERKPEPGDPDYDLSAFKQDVFGGPFRRAYTLATFGMAIVVGSMFLTGNPTAIYGPIYVTGTPAKVFAVLILLGLASIAVGNWWVYFRARRNNANTQSSATAPAPPRSPEPDK
jgi:hypothetical protein